MPALDDVLDALARALDHPGDPPPAVLGEFTLRPHQVDAVRAIRASFREFGGALLADDPGLGKTVVALAVATTYSRTLVTAPAALRGMWRAAAARAAVPIDFVSLDALSRGRVVAPAPLLVVDEAHHAANPAARRYPALSVLAHGAHVLLLSATPVRNRRAELDVLLALFLGSRVLDDSARARCCIRRRISDAAGVPARVRQPDITIRVDVPLARRLRALPPPLPVANGDAAAGLVRTGLVRCWASSVAALDRALARRLQRAAALAATLEEGRLPTQAELRAWVIGDDSMQLALPILASRARIDVSACQRTLTRHTNAIRAIRDAVRPTAARDARERARQLIAVVERHPGARVIAFTAFEATAVALFAVLRRRAGTVLLTSRGARSGAGALDRTSVINALATVVDARAASDDASARRNAVNLVIATDLLAEGVNLQAASVIVHLDFPWTPAGLAQRVGRAARIGSPHAEVFEYRFAAPKAADRLLRFAQLQRRKSDDATRALAPGTAHERLMAATRSWRAEVQSRSPAAAAAIGGTVDGFIARIESPSRASLVGGMSTGATQWRISDDPALLAQLAESVRRTDAQPVDRREVDRVAHSVVRWLARRDGAAVAGVGAGALGASVTRRRIFARLDRLLHTASPGNLPALAARVGRIRAALQQRSNAGVELHLTALLGRDCVSVEWLDEIEQRLAGIARRWTDSRSGAQLSCVLMIRRRPRT